MVRSCKENVLTMKLVESMKEYDEMIKDIICDEAIHSITYHLIEDENASHFKGRLIIRILAKSKLHFKKLKKFEDKGFILLKEIVISSDLAEYTYEFSWG